MKYKQRSLLLLLAAMTAASLLFTGCMRMEPHPGRAAQRLSVADEMDCDVISAVLESIYQDPTFNLCAVKPESRIAFSLHTPTTNQLDDVVNNTLGPDFQKWLGVRIPKELINEFYIRNSRAARFDMFTTSNTNIVVLPDLQNIFWGLITGAGDMPPDCRGGIASYLPAYSADLSTAIVVFICFPNLHNAPAGTYYLRKEENGWVVHSGKIWMYM